MSSTARRSWTAAALVAALLVAVVAVGLATGRIGEGPFPGTGDGDTTSGMVVRYQGRDYWVSDYYVAESQLRGTLAREQPFMDTAVELRAIQGQDPAVTLAAYLPPLSQASPEPGWHLVSTDAGYWTDPAAVDAHPSLFAVAP